MCRNMRDMDRVDKEELFPLVGGSVAKGHGSKVRGRRFRGCEETLLHPEGADSLKCAA